MVIDRETGIVSLSKDEYDELLDAADRYYALRNGGVDNWEWYDNAMEDYFDAKDD